MSLKVYVVKVYVVKVYVAKVKELGAEEDLHD